MTMRSEEPNHPRSSHPAPRNGSAAGPAGSTAGPAGTTAGPAGTTAGFIGRHPWLRRGLLILIDGALLWLAFTLAYKVAFLVRPGLFTPSYHEQLRYVVPYIVALRLVLLAVFGLYRGFARYTSISELLSILWAGALGAAALLLFNKLAPYIPRLGDFPLHASGDYIRPIPRSIPLIDAMLAIGLVGGAHLLRRIVAERLAAFMPGDRRRVLIVGAGGPGEQVARDLMRNLRDRFRPVAFVDPDPTLRGRRIHGIPVAGTLEDLERVTRRYRVRMVVIALPRPTPGLLRQIVDHCQKARLQFQIIPDLDSVISGQVQVSRLRPVEIEDLLGRPPIVLPNEDDHSCVRGRRVLITGAGGSIGSELCRQALAQKPASITLLGRGENSLYEIHQELAARARELGIPLEVVVGDIRDAALVRALMERVRPQLVLHAAAHKHVHFMEAQPAEAIKNNVGGTRNLAEAALAAGAERFILISTDKAVRPLGVMGASKRVAEMIVGALNGAGQGAGPTRFIAVRFGNVLGSRGSVIPLFRRQIAAGGPVTVTHPEVTRYFMTIPEAVSLVLEAGARGEGGEVFLLDMGQPIRIVDLARNLITLSGLEPGRDIAIEFTGLRAGEKLFEELFTDREQYAHTSHSKIFRCPQEPREWAALAPRIAQLEASAARGDAEAIRTMLRDLIPDYRQPAPEDGATPAPASAPSSSS